MQDKFLAHKDGKTLLMTRERAQLHSMDEKRKKTITKFLQDQLMLLTEQYLNRQEIKKL